MSRVVFLAEARAEALETFRWYEEQRPGLGAVFRRELDDAIKRIRSAPLAYPPLRLRHLPDPPGSKLEGYGMR